MKSITLCIAAILLSSSLGMAQTTIIQHDRDGAPPAMMDQRDAPAVETRSKVETDSNGCKSATVTKDNGMGDSKTVSKTNC